MLTIAQYFQWQKMVFLKILLFYQILLYSNQNLKYLSLTLVKALILMALGDGITHLVF